MSAVLSKTVSKLSVFATLFSYEAKGLFFLRYALNEHTSSAGLDSIMKKAMALYDASLDENKIAFTPCFKFAEVDGKVKMTIRRCPCLGHTDLHIADVMLIAVADPASPWNQHLLLEETNREPELF